MAVAPTGAIYKALEFDGVSSRTYGVYITGEAVYNAPERDVEMVTIPGRNGSFALDNGRFQNIEVSYPAGIFAETEADFRAAISDFRNFLCSRNGYVRLQDEYNPDEYRMAVYKSGLEVTPAQLKAGEFTITFDCKPQRWLTSGETEVTIANSGDTITNPTLFESSPLVEVEGYGNINFNEQDITVYNATLGDVVLALNGSFNGVNNQTTVQRAIQLTTSMLNTNDDFSINFPAIQWYIRLFNPDGFGWLFDPTFTWQTVTDSESNATTTLDAGQTIPTVPFDQPSGQWTSGYKFTTVVNSIPFKNGTSKTWTNIATLPSTPIVKKESGVLYNSSISGTFTLTIAYDGDSEITITASVSVSDMSLLRPNYAPIILVKYSDIKGESTISTLGDPTYIDLDLGEAYMIDSGVVVSLNNSVSIPPTLPTLASGVNEITFDNTITDLKIVPRWWKI